MNFSEQSVPEILEHVAGTLSNQPTNKQIPRDALRGHSPTGHLLHCDLTTCTLLLSFSLLGKDRKGGGGERRKDRERERDRDRENGVEGWVDPAVPYARDYLSREQETTTAYILSAWSGFNVNSKPH